MSVCDRQSGGGIVEIVKDIGRERERETSCDDSSLFLAGEVAHRYRL